jgi:hypothetical protein
MKRTVCAISLFLVLLFPLVGAAPETPKVSSEVMVVKKADPTPAPIVPLEFSLLGADKILPKGDIAELSITTKNALPDNLVEIQYKWKISFQNGPERKVKSDGANGILFGTGIVDDVANVEWAVSYTLKDDKGAKLFMTEINKAQVVLGNIPLPPTPGPDPTPPPAPKPVDPTFEDGTFKFAKFAYDNFKGITSSAKVEVAQGFAKDFKTVADNIDKNKYATLSAAFEELVKLNKSVVSGKADFDAFNVAVRAEIYKVYQAGKLKTLADYSTLFKEIATGLEGVK